MINTSSEYKSKIRKNRIFIPKANITLANSTVLSLEKEDIMQGYPRIDDSVCDKIAIGTAIINKCTLVLNNFSGKFNNYDFTDAVIRPYAGLQLSGTIEYLAKGVFTTDIPNAKGSIIVLESLDNMAKFNKEFSGVIIPFPCTALQLLQAICLYCGVSLNTVSFFNYDYVVNDRPADNTASCREIIAWIAQIAGCFARCNNQGALELKWFDFDVFESEIRVNGGEFDSDTPYSSGDDVNGGNFTDYSSGETVNGGTFDIMSRYHHIYSFSGTPSIGTDDIVITGVQVTDSAENPTTVLFGTAGYILPISGNQLIQNSTQANIVANTVGAKIVGMRFRSFSGSAQSDPSMEAGDVAYISDRKRNSYPTLITSLSYEMNNYEPVACGAETPAKKGYRSTPEIKAIVEARKNTETLITAYDEVVQRMTEIIANGYGMYPTKVTDESGATIFYLHDKPTMAESTVRWFTTSEGTVEQVKTLGVWVTVSGVDKQGNALYNVLTARKVSADIIRTGKIYSDDGATLIDMASGVANSDNISTSDNVADGFPLRISFNIDEDTGVISKVKLKWYIDKFRTYSTTASSGGASSVSSNSGGGTTSTTGEYTGNYWTEAATQEISAGNTALTTNSSGGTTHTHTIDNHSHELTMYSHNHYIENIHNHNVSLPNHTHTVDTPDHTHGLNFGIMEKDVVHNLITIRIDGVDRTSVNDTQGTIDLTAWITTTGWHTIELFSATLKRISAQVNIKSYIKM